MEDSAIQINISSSSSTWSIVQRCLFIRRLFPLAFNSCDGSTKGWLKKKILFLFHHFIFLPRGMCTSIASTTPRPLYIDWFSLRSFPSLFPLLIVPLFARFPFNGAQVAEKLRPTRVSRNSTNSLGIAQTTSSSLGSEMIVLWCPIDWRETEIPFSFYPPTYKSL